MKIENLILLGTFNSSSVQLVFGFEYAILMTIVANTVVKYVLHSVDLYSEAPWENKAVFMLYTELFIGLIKVFLVKQGLRTLLRIRIRDPVLF
jgi:E3 ubiquitin-protein ligase synoviolin